jgi:hypothetical protein
VLVAVDFMLESFLEFVHCLSLAKKSVFKSFFIYNPCKNTFLYTILVKIIGFMAPKSVPNRHLLFTRIVYNNGLIFGITQSLSSLISGWKAENFSNMLCDKLAKKSVLKSFFIYNPCKNNYRIYL